MKIIIYGTSWCKPCSKTKDFFEQKSIDYQFIDVDDNLDIMEEKKIYTVPIIEFYNNEDSFRFKGSIEDENDLNEVKKEMNDNNFKYNEL